MPAPNDGGSNPTTMLDGAVMPSDGGTTAAGPARATTPARTRRRIRTRTAARRRRPHGKEDCSNGIDDDGDGDPDCADDDCAARSCVGAAPSGWTGPSVVYVGSDPPNCGGDYARPTLNGGTAVDADPADCSTCSCSNSTAACATFVNIVASTDSQCGGVTCTNSITDACEPNFTPVCVGSAATRT